MGDSTPKNGSGDELVIDEIRMHLPFDFHIFLFIGNSTSKADPVFKKNSERGNANLRETHI
jgi:hypothetical protein